MTQPRAIIGGMLLAGIIATMLVFYYASVSKVSPRSSAKNAALSARALPTKAVSP